MRRPRLDDRDLAASELALLLAGLDAERPLDDREALALRRMDVSGSDEAVRLHRALDDDRLAVGVRRCGPEGDALSRDRIVNRVAGADHLYLLHLD